MDDEVIKTGEVMRLLGVSRETVRLWALAGEIRTARQSKGGTRFFYRREIEALMNEDAVAAQAAEALRQAEAGRAAAAEATEDARAFAWLLLARADREDFLTDPETLLLAHGLTRALARRQGHVADGAEALDAARGLALAASLAQDGEQGGAAGPEDVRRLVDAVRGLSC